MFGIDPQKHKLDGIAMTLAVAYISRRISDGLIWNAWVDVRVLGQVQIILQGTDNNTLNDFKGGLKQRVRDSLYSHATSLHCINEASS